MRAVIHTVTDLPCVFVIGLRRSGTSFTRQCLNRLGCDLLFEPRDLWWALTQGHLPRFRRCVSTTAPIAEFRSALLQHGPRYGAKFALEPGISAMYWRYLPDQFPGARFVFVRRNWQDNYTSYVRADRDEPQGVVSESVFREIHGMLADTYCVDGRSAVVDYDDMLCSGRLPESVGDLLGLGDLDVSGFIRTPANIAGLAREVAT